MTVPLTGLYAGILTCMMLILNFRVVGIRVRGKIGIGTGGVPELERAIRAHGNFLENVPMTLLLIGLLELNGASSYLLHSFGAGLVLGRGLHAIGLSHTPGVSPGRTLGMLTTYLVQIIAAAGLVYQFTMTL